MGARETTPSAFATRKAGYFSLTLRMGMIRKESDADIAEGHY
jgi:hypothetical protein